jgi:hypothetical protein
MGEMWVKAKERNRTQGHNQVTWIIMTTNLPNSLAMLRWEFNYYQRYGGEYSLFRDPPLAGPHRY